MRQILYMIAVLLLAGSFYSCRQEGLSGSGTGWLYVGVERDSSLEDISPEMPELKSLSADDLVFAIDIMQGGELVKSVDDHHDLSSTPVELNTGNYTLVARSVVDGEVDYSVPYYSGTAEFTVKPDVINTVQVTCSLANVKVTASFDSSISGNGQISSCILTVGNGEDEPLIFGFSDGSPVGEDGAGYLRTTGVLEWTLSITNTENYTTTVTKTIDGVRERQHYAFSFSLVEDAEFGGGYFRIVLDGEMNDREEVGTVYLGAEKPVVSAEGFDLAGAEFVAGNESSKVMVFSHVSDDAEAGLRSVSLSHGNEQLAAAGLPYNVELVGASAELVAALGEAGINVASVAEGVQELRADFGLFFGRLPLGAYSISYRAVARMGTYLGGTLDFTVLTNSDADVVSNDPWACFADLKGKWYASERPEGLTFQYRKAAETSWTDFVGESVFDDASKTYTGRITGLAPETEYVWRAVSAADKSEGKESPEMTFVTEHVQTVPNLSFDSWYKDGDAWMPNDDMYIWDSANKGTAGYGYVPTTPEESDVAVAGEGKKAAKLTSMKAHIVIVDTFAAGNLYTGKFGSAIVDLKDPGAILEWGVPFSARPLALKGYYKYLPQTVNNGNHNHMEGKTDICQIQIFLFDRDAPFQINTQKGTFLKPDDESVIAYGTLEDSRTMDGYESFTIKLDYRSMTRKPKYIAIAAAASKYGDYFTGGDGSVLYLDEFELVYDPAALSTR